MQIYAMIKIAAVQISIIFHSCFIGITEASEEIPVLLYYQKGGEVMKLTEKQKRFCEEYLIDLNATQAAVRAGYKNSDVGRRLVTKSHVLNYISELQKEQSKRTGISADTVLKELQKVAFAETDISGKEKIKALELLGKHLGLFSDQLKPSGEQGTSCPLESSGRRRKALIFQKLSEKQKLVFRWCYSDKFDAIICDGSVRSGKTASMSCSFVLWAMRNFNQANFAFCGNTVQAVERNILMPMQTMIDITHYFNLKYLGSKHVLTISGNGHENHFYLFGGKDESSYKLVQGITLSGVLFDETALMPESFVNQTIARTLSVSGAKLWFNCNPDSPMHWFYQQWILQAEQKNALYIHFEMQDNPAMTPDKIHRTENLYFGVFYERYIKGRWVLADGLIYPMFDKSKHLAEPPEDFEKLSGGSFLYFCRLWHFESYVNRLVVSHTGRLRLQNQGKLL